MTAVNNRVYLHKTTSLKTPIERKLENEKFLNEQGILINENLPTIENEEETIIRPAGEIARRILIICYLNMIVEGVDRNEIIPFLKESKLWSYCSPNEIQMLERGGFSNQEKIDLSWQSEAVWVMLWALHKIDKLELPVEQCEVAKIVELIPDYLEPFEGFIQSVEIRDTSDILDQSDLIYRLHWATRHAYLNNVALDIDLDLSIIQEWHYAINWITSYGDLDWDDVTTDT